MEKRTPKEDETTGVDDSISLRIPITVNAREYKNT